VTSTELIVLIVRDHSLRSALIARLSLQGESLVTLDADPDDPLLHRAAPAPRILVIDEAALGHRLQPLIDSNNWRGIIVIADSLDGALAGDRLRMVHHERALADVVDTLADWRVPALSGSVSGRGE
jgi:hypothetical protein